MSHDGGSEDDEPWMSSAAKRAGRRRGVGVADPATGRNEFVSQARGDPATEVVSSGKDLTDSDGSEGSEGGETGHDANPIDIYATAGQAAPTRHHVAAVQPMPPAAGAGTKFSASNLSSPALSVSPGKLQAVGGGGGGGKLKALKTAGDMGLNSKLRPVGNSQRGGAGGHEGSSATWSVDSIEVTRQHRHRMQAASSDSQDAEAASSDSQDSEESREEEEEEEDNDDDDGDDDDDDGQAVEAPNGNRRATENGKLRQSPSTSGAGGNLRKLQLLQGASGMSRTVQSSDDDGGGGAPPARPSRQLANPSNVFNSMISSGDYEEQAPKQTARRPTRKLSNPSNVFNSMDSSGDYEDLPKATSQERRRRRTAASSATRNKLTQPSGMFNTMSSSDDFEAAFSAGPTPVPRAKRGKQKTRRPTRKLKNPSNVFNSMDSSGDYVE